MLLQQLCPSNRRMDPADAHVVYHTINKKAEFLWQPKLWLDWVRRTKYSNILKALITYLLTAHIFSSMFCFDQNLQKDCKELPFFSSVHISYISWHAKYHSTVEC